MQKFFLKQTLIIILFFFVVFIFSPKAFAQIKIEKLNSDQVFGDFVIGPGKHEIFLEPGERTVVNITVTNRMGVPRNFNLDVEDFTGSNDPEQPVVLLGNERGPYSLKDYIFLEDKSFVLENGERAVVPVVVSIPPDASPGGLYGSVLVSTNSIKKDDGSSAGAAIISRIGSLFFVTVPGDVKKEGELVDFSTAFNKKFFLNGPIDFNILFQNKGNIYLNPYGYIKVKNILGNEVGDIDVKPWFALPNSLRLREVSWTKPFLFGRYVATLELYKGIGDEIDIKKIVFYVLPLKIIISTFIILFLISFLVNYILSHFEIKRKQ